MSGTPVYISTATTTNVSKIPCTLKRVVVGTTAAGAIKIYNSTSGTASGQIGELKTSVVEGSYEFDMFLKTGCQVLTDAASKITVVIE